MGHTKQQSLADELAEWVANETGAEEDADMFDSLVARVRELEAERDAYAKLAAAARRAALEEALDTVAVEGRYEDALWAIRDLLDKEPAP